MADFFGGILDSIRNIGDDVDGFFDTTIGNAVGKGIMSLGKKDQQKSGVNLTDGFVPIGSGNFSPSSRDRDLTSEDFANTEAEWLNRMKRFTSMNTGTNVKLGG